MRIWRPKAAYQARKEGDWPVLRGELESLLCPEDVDVWWTDYLLNRARDLPTDWTELVREACQERIEELRATQMNRAMDAEYAATVTP